MADAARTYPFAFEPLYRVLSTPFGVTPGRCWVRLGGGELRARFGPWHLSTPVDNLAGAEVTGPYTIPKTAGPAHLSFADRGLTFATNRRQGACIRFREPVPGIAPFGALEHPALTVTVEDVAGLVAEVNRLTGGG